MAYFEWTDKLSVQVKELDDQHKKLIAIINRLHEAMLANKGQQLQKDILYEVVEYAAIHFALEEQYMKRSNYPGFEAHCLEHEQFAVEAVELKRKADRHGPVLSLEILTFLKDWLQNHILVTDMKYVGHFKAHGLA